MIPRAPIADIVVGTAGWSIPRACAGDVAGAGTHLSRYAAALRGAEINSSFWRPHRAQVYEKWAMSTPPGFRFAVKVPRSITHEGALRAARQPLQLFLAQCGGLGAKLAALLVQLPPKFAFDRAVARRFFALLRQLYGGAAVCEPRHATWLSSDADQLLCDYQIGRVAADPPRAPGFAVPGGWPGVVYLRLHGSPRTYWSPYESCRLEAFADQLTAARAEMRWCMFDNTASGAALANALELQQILTRADPRQPREGTPM